MKIRDFLQDPTSPEDSQRLFLNFKRNDENIKSLLKKMDAMLRKLKMPELAEKEGRLNLKFVNAKTDFYEAHKKGKIRKMHRLAMIIDNLAGQAYEMHKNIEDIYYEKFKNEVK